MIIQKYFSDRKKLIEHSLTEVVAEFDLAPKNLKKAIEYNLFNGGRRFRSIMMFATYEMLKGKNNLNSIKQLVPAATSIELVHTAFQVHNDLPCIDDLNYRRGQPSCHKKFSESTAILVGDALITKAFENLTKISKSAIFVQCFKLLAYSISTRGILGGQTVEIESTKKKIKLNTLRYIHMKKTGSLLSATTGMACLFYGVEENFSILIRNYAVNLGLAFQIIEDIVEEIESIEDEEYQKKKSANRTTYPSLIGLENSIKSSKKLLDDAYRIIKNMKNNQILIELIAMVKERLP